MFRPDNPWSQLIARRTGGSSTGVSTNIAANSIISEEQPILTCVASFRKVGAHPHKPSFLSKSAPT